MKKLLLTSIAVAAYGVNTFGQGVVLFENTANSSVYVTLNESFAQGGMKTGSGLVVELLWNDGSSYVLQDTFTSTFTGNGSGSPFQSPGVFQAGLVSVDAPLGKDTFEVEGFYTSGQYIYSGIPAVFTATVATGGPTSPASGIDVGVGSFSGNLILYGGPPPPTPEPSTIAVGGLGAAALWLFRRRRLR